MTPAWSPQNPPSSLFTSATLPPTSPDPSPAPDFPPFNVAQLLKEGTLLLASSGKEYSEPVALGTPAEVARARKEAMSRLGLGFMDEVGADDDDDDALDFGKELSQSQPVKAAKTPEPMDVDSPAVIAVDVKPNQLFTNPSGPYSPAATPDQTSSTSSPSLSAADIKPPPAFSLSHNTANTTTTSYHHNHPNAKFTPKIKTEIAESPEPPLESGGPDGAALSARERNRLKRKLKTGNSAFVPSTPSSAAGGTKTPGAGPSSSPITAPPNKSVHLL